MKDLKLGWGLFLALIGFIIVADRATKAWLASGSGCALGFCAQPSINTGAAFGLLPGNTALFIISALAVLILIVVFYPRVKSASLQIALALIAGGTVSNLIDRSLYGYVVDVVTFSFVSFPSFNVADIANTAGAALLLISLANKI